MPIHLALAILTGLLLLTTTHAASQVIILNSCPSPVQIYYTPAPQNSSSIFLLTVPPTANYTDVYPYYPNKFLLTFDALSTTSPVIENVTAPHTVFQAWWPEDEWDVSYALYDLYGDVFKGNRVSLKAGNKSCASVVWEDGVPPVEYGGVGPVVTNKCSGSFNLTLEVCQGGEE